MGEVTMTEAQRIAELEAEVARLHAELAQERADTVAFLAERGTGASDHHFFRGARAAYRSAAMFILGGAHRARSAPVDDGVGAEA